MADLFTESRAMKCETCRWWGGEGRERTKERIGTCRRHAPKPITELWRPGPTGDQQEYLMAHWRWTHATAWCGEHARRVPEGDADGPG